MKKVLVISDTHLYNDIFDIFKDEKYDYYIHCGDSSLNRDDPLLKNYIVVEGNHDNNCFNNIEFLTIEKYSCMVTHGNNFNIFMGVDEIDEFMTNNNIDICFHGHTHVPNFVKKNNHYIINPGSTMFNRGDIATGTYAVVTIDDDVSIQFYDSSNKQKISITDIYKNAEILEEYKQILKK